MKVLLTSVLFAALTSFTGCAPFPPYYAPPANLTPQTAAIVVGSMTIDPSPVSPNTKAIISDVDGEITRNLPYDWQTPILLMPGFHTLSIFLCKCSNFAGRAVTGGFALPAANFEAGGHYTVRTTLPTGGSGFERHFVTSWIEDSNGISITPHNKFEVDDSNPPIVRIFEDPTYKGN